MKEEVTAAVHPLRRRKATCEAYASAASSQQASASARPTTDEAVVFSPARFVAIFVW